MPLLLKLNLQFFAADEGGTGAEGAAAAAGTGSDDSSWIDDLYSGGNDEGKTDENMIPKSRFDSVNEKYKQLSSDSKAKEAGYAESATKLEAAENTAKELGGRVESLEAVFKTMVDAEMEQIDESFHDLIPTDKSVEQQLDWIMKAKQKGMFGLTGSGSMEFEIGNMSNPKGNGKGRSTEGLNPIQLLTMGYGK